MQIFKNFDNHTYTHMYIYMHLLLFKNFLHAYVTNNPSICTHLSGPHPYILCTNLHGHSYCANFVIFYSYSTHTNTPVTITLVRPIKCFTTQNKLKADNKPTKPAIKSSTLPRTSSQGKYNCTI